ncbi:DUF4412 domain-containing protein [Subsaximicrobium wynnwilliamsii]|uniref:DUF4412 domain-containing protein n=1 Tax=Subsaximicrobium wynnwilliamsii TaxID=291179 RepID=A0A5C6ZHR0_9FLAO|nr:DUF4412 domain-containing protein [Subsaximicrobium wynnwilliamsii]TXD83083.1 DUF4412 domain-containing protein [Subsaximicrobium wynnwilliamsii]TXD88827.1 DUF4412 domain-containing protein [Subsaximicrobium wynnwilliamsii]TXE02900.1 DUF4412 domain-containing protein [Subsaximicrobium wynnwilliamsii]
MKSRFSVVIIMIAFLAGGSANAQFFKKLKKKAEQAAERTILNRADEEVSKGTDKTIDKAIEGDANKQKDSSKSRDAMNKRAMSVYGGDMNDIPETYKFQYIMDMKMTTNKDDMRINYYIQPNASYFGTAVPSGQDNNSVVVYDLAKEAMVTFIDANGQKMAMKVNMPLDEKMQESIKNGQLGQDGSAEDVEVTPLASKTILGYHCKGYQIKNEDGSTKVYITNEAPVSFVGMFANMKDMQKNMGSSAIPFDENSMMLEMEYNSSTRKKERMHMICTAIKEQSFSISKADYN